LTRLKAAVGVGLPESERSRAPGPGLFCLQGLLQRVKTALFARASFSWAHGGQRGGFKPFSWSRCCIRPKSRNRLRLCKRPCCAVMICAGHD